MTVHAIAPSRRRGARKPVAWLSAVALAASGLVLASQSAPPLAEAAEPTLRTTQAGYTLKLSSRWDPEGVSVRNYLFVIGASPAMANTLGLVDDDGGKPNSRTFIGYWEGAPNDNDPIVDPTPTLAAGFMDPKNTGGDDDEDSEDASTEGNADLQGRVMAIDSGEYDNPEGREAGYVGNGVAMYVWSNFAIDYWKNDPNHPAEFTDAMIGTRPGSSGLCRPSNWTSANHGSWVSIVMYKTGETDGTVFWVPNPRAADVMYRYDSDTGGPNDYPGVYAIDKAAEWPCTAKTNSDFDDAWGGGEVIQATGELFFSAKQTAKLDSTYRAMIFNPVTGEFASSGLLQPASAGDAIFASNATVAGDLMVDGDGNGYVIVEGRAPSTSIWHDPNDTNASGSERAYIVRIVPTLSDTYLENPENCRNADGDISTSCKYVHNGRWSYNIVQRVYTDPNANGDLGYGYDLQQMFGKTTPNNTDIHADFIKGSNWYNGLLYAGSSFDLFAINPMSGLASHVPDDANTHVRNLYPNDIDRVLRIRDFASGQEALTIDGTVFYDKNGNGVRDEGEWGIPGVKLALYSDHDGDGNWTLEASDHQTDSSGGYTFFLSGWGRYQIRVLDPAFNPDDGGKEATIHNGAVAAVQTAASSGSSNYQGHVNTVTAHCYDYAAGQSKEVVSDKPVTLASGSDELAPCAGNLAYPYTDGALATPAEIGGKLNPATTNVAIYSTLDVTSAHYVPDADFGLAVVTPYKAGASSDGDTDTFNVAGQSLKTTAENVIVTSAAIPNRPGYQLTPVQAPSTDWTVAKVEIRSGNSVVDTPAYSVDQADATKGTFQWLQPAQSELTAVVYFKKDLACDPATSELAVSPAGPIAAGQSYTLTVTAKDKSGAICKSPATIAFAAEPNTGPTFSPATCTTSLTDGTCQVQATSTKAGEWKLHATMADPATGNQTDIKNSPATRRWTHASCDSNQSSFVMVPDERAVGETSVATLTLKDQYGNVCDDVTPVLSDTDGLTFAIASGPGSAADNPDTSKQAEGIYTWPLTTTKEGVYKPKATIPASGGSPAAVKEAQVTFTDSDVSGEKSWLSAVPDDGSVPVYVEESYKVTAHVRNDSDSPLEGVTVSFAGAGLAYTPATCTTNAAGECTVSVSTAAPAHKSGTFNVSATADGTTIQPRGGAGNWPQSAGRYLAPAAPALKFWGGPDITNAELSADPMEQVAGSPVKVHIRALDKYDNPVEDLVRADFTLKGDPVSPASNPAIGPSDYYDDSGAAQGDYYLETTSKITGTFKLTGTGRGQEITHSPAGHNDAEPGHPVIEFVAGPVCVVNCTPGDTGRPDNLTRIEMVKNGALADGKDQDTARAHAFDRYGNAVEGASVVSNRAPSSPDLSPATQTAKTAADGTAMLAWTSLKAGQYTAQNIIDGNTTFPGSALDNIRFVQTAASADKSTLDITPPKAERPIPAGDSYTAKVTANDADGRPVAGVPVTFGVQPKAGTTPRYPAELSASTCTTGADGTCQVTVLGKSAGDYEISAKVPDGASGTPTHVGGNGDPNRASPQDVAWKAGDVCVVTPTTPCDDDPAFQTSVKVTKNDQPGNGVAADEATVKAFDAYGNPVPDAVYHSAKVSAGDPLTVVNPDGQTDAQGQAVIQYTATADGSYQADVTVGGKTPPESPITLRFTHAPGTCTMTKEPAIDLKAGEQYTISTHCTNEAGAPDAGKAVNHKASSPDLTFADGVATCTTDATGTCSVKVTSTKAGTYEVDYVDPPAAHVDGAPMTVVFLPGDASELSETKVLKNGAHSDGVDRDLVQVTAKDKYGNVVPGVAVQSSSQKSGITIQPDIPATDANGQVTIWYTSTTATTYDVDFLVGSAVPKGGDGSPVKLGFMVGDVASVELTVRPKDPAQTAPIVVGKDAANTYVLEGKAKDATGNPVEGAIVQFAINPTEGPTFVDNARSCVTGADGTCSIEVYSTKAGSYVGTAAVGNIVSQGKDIVWRPDKVCGVECTPDPSTPEELWTRIVMTVNRQTADGQHADVAKLWAYDKWGNPVPNQIVVSTPDSADLKVMDSIPVTGDGTNGTTLGVSEIKYYSTVAGTYHPGVKVGTVTDNPADMQTPHGLPLDVIFVAGDICFTEPQPGVPADQRTRLEVTKNGAVADGHATNEVTVYAFDCYGNAVAGAQPGSTPAAPVAVSGTIPQTDEAGKAVIAYTADAEDEVTGAVVPVTLPDGDGQQQPVTYYPVGSSTPKAFDPAHPSDPASSPVLLDFADATPTVEHDPPAITTVAGQDVTGGKKALTNDATPPIAGTGVAGDTVKVKDEAGAVLCTATVAPNGTWTCSPSQPLADGDHKVTATQTPAGPGGVESKPSNEAAFTVDTTAPCIVNDPRPICQDDGNGGKPPFFDITKPAEGEHVGDSKPTFAGTGETPGDKVEIKEGDTLLCETTVQPDRTWTCQSTKELPDGTHTVTGRETDAAGNVSEPVDRTFVIDTVPPVVWVDKPKPGASINNESAWPVAGRVTEPDGTTPVPDAKVTVKDKASGALLCDATSTATGTWTCDVPKGKPGPDGEYTLVVTATDKAGNVSEPKEVPFSIDTTPPDIKITSPKPNDQVKDDPIRVTGTGETPGDIVTVDDGHGHTCQTTVQADKTWACDLANVPEGTVTITAKETDAAGNVGSDEVTFTVDRTAPCIVNDPRPICQGKADYFDILKVDGMDVTDNKPDYTANPQPKIEGKGEAAGDKVKITEGGKVLCETTVLADKTWNCTPAEPLADGKHVIQGTETDPAGNVSDPVEREFTVDTVAPPTPVITKPAEGAKINDPTPEVAGTIPAEKLDPGTVVIVQDKADPANQCTATVQADRTWACSLPKPLPDGDHTVTAQAKDPAGNLSGKDEVTFTVDTVPPPIYPDTSDPAHIGVDTDPHADVEIRNEDGKVICTAKADDKGHAVCSPAPGDVPKPGDWITIKATDEAGNSSELRTRIIQVVVSEKSIVLPDKRTQTATGYYFQPGEQVHGVMNSDPMDLGYQTADSTGKVVFTWTIPDSDSYVGTHVVTLTGAKSGPGKDDFQVSRALPTTGSGVDGGLVAVAGLTLLAGVLCLVAAKRRRDRAEVNA